MKTPWDKKPLDELCIFLNGLWTGKKSPFITVGVIRNTNFEKDNSLDFTNIAYLEVEKRQFDTRKLQVGDIILEKSGGGPKQPVGRVVIFDREDGDYSFSNFTSVIRIMDNNQINYAYLHKYLTYIYQCGVTEKMQSHSTGIRNLKFDEYKKLLIPVPSLPEQQRIVAFLDQALAGIAVAKANVEKNLQNARELFETFLNNKFAALADNWEQETLGNICSKITDGTHVTPKYRKEGIPFLSVKNVTNGCIDFSNTRFISVEEHKFLTKNNCPEKGDILYSKVGTTGVARVIDTDREFSIFVSLALLKIRHDLIFNRYLEYFLNSPYAREQARKRTRGMANKNLVITEIKEINIQYPKSLKDQHNIVTKLDEINGQTRELEINYQRKLFELEELKKSILQKAFSGELTGG